MKELISVIVPVYNAEKYIRKCVASIQEQSYSHFELILINDGSKDNSLALCQELATLDQRIIVHDRINGGASAARNTGLDIAKGDYIVFVVLKYAHMSTCELFLRKQRADTFV